MRPLESVPVPTPGSSPSMTTILRSLQAVFGGKRRRSEQHEVNDCYWQDAASVPLGFE